MSFEVKKAQRQGARLLIQLSGVSGSGKTFTALQLAYGMTGNDANKVVLIDAENRRGSLYANALPQPFNIIDFYAPFSPERYIQAIDAACKAGAEVIVIDSVSHEWEGPGGCQDIAALTKFPDWNRAKVGFDYPPNAVVVSMFVFYVEELSPLDSIGEIFKVAATVEDAKKRGVTVTTSDRLLGKFA